MLLFLEINCGERSFWFKMIPVFLNFHEEGALWSGALLWSKVCPPVWGPLFHGPKVLSHGLFWHFKKSKLTQNIFSSWHKQPVPEWYSNVSMGLFALCPLSLLFCNTSLENALNYEVITPEILGILGTSL